MAASMEAMLKIAARVEGANTIQAFSRDLKSLDGAAKLSTADLGRMQYAINKMGREAGNTTSGIRAHVAALENLRSRVDIGSKAYGRLGNEIDQLRGKLRGLDGEVKRSGINLSQVVGGAAGALLAGVGIAGAGATAAAIGRVGIDAETAQVRLKALTEEFGEYNEAQASAARIAATLRISQIEASDGLSKLYAALRPTGVTLQEVEDAFIGFTAAARASGSTATESSAALLQLKQALGSGVLQGDELRSIREQAPAAAQAIAREMGVTIGELKKLGSEGKITTDIVLRALARLKGESLGKLNAQFATSGQAMKDLQVAAEEFGTTIAQVFGPTAVGLVKGFTEAVKRLNDATFAFRSPTAATAREIIQSGRLPGGALPQSVLMQGAGELFKGSSGAGGVGMTGLRKEAEQLAKLRKQPVNDVLFELMKNRLGRVDSQQTASAGQLAEQQSAAREREAGRARAGEEERKKAAKEAEKEREKAAKEAQRLAEETARARIELDNTLHQNAIELIRKRYEFERELQDRSADNWVKRYTGAARSAAGIISGALRGFDELAGRQREADVGILNARQALSSAKRQEAIGAGAAGPGATRLPGSISGRLDASGQNGADMPVGLNNAIQSYHNGLVKALGKAGNNGNYIVIDFIDDLGNKLEATYSHVAAAVKEGQRVVGGQVIGRFDGSGRTTGPHNSVDINSLGNNGSFQRGQETSAARRSADILATGRVQGRTTGSPSGTGAGAGSAAAGDTMQATANLAQARALAALEKGQIEKLKTSIGEGFVLDFTDQLKLQNAELVNQNAITQLRNRLQMEGVRPEIIEAEAQKTQKIREVGQETGVATDALKRLVVAGEGGSEQANSLREAIALQNEGLQTFISRTNEATAAQIAFNDAIKFRQDSNVGAGLREGAQGYIESIGTMREATAQLAQSGIGGIENALTSLATTGKANFREFAVDMLKQTARMIIQQMVLRTVLQAVGAIGGAAAGGGGGGGITGSVAGVKFNPAAYTMPSLMNANGNAFAQNGIQAFAMGGIVNSPTLFKFAQGGAMRNGLMGEAGPEAIMPLRRLPGGRLGVESTGGGTSAPITVMVNVDAKGTAVESNQTEGAQLGRAISAAVQAELVKQQRPGGLLAGTRR